MSLIALIRAPAPMSPPSEREFVQPVPIRTLHPLRAFADGRFATGTIAGSPRLSDTINTSETLVVHESLPAAEGDWQGSATGVSQLALDPRDVELVLGAPLRMTPEQRQARRVFKVRYPVAIWTSSFVLLGLMHLFPGIDPEHALAASGPRFLALTQSQVWHGDEAVGETFDVALVNRAFVHSVERAQLLMD